MLHGYGQPMHAFDLSKLAGQTVVVRRARGGERMVTLDGVDRALDERMTMIADAQNAVAIGGVMGGRDSEVTDGDDGPVARGRAASIASRIRVTRRALGLATDASYRFERGVDAAAIADAARAGGGTDHEAGRRLSRRRTDLRRS